MSKTAINADVGTSEKLLSVISQQPSICSPWLLPKTIIMPPSLIISRETDCMFFTRYQDFVTSVSYLLEVI